MCPSFQPTKSPDVRLRSRRKAAQAHAPRPGRPEHGSPSRPSPGKPRSDQFRRHSRCFHKDQHLPAFKRERCGSAGRTLRNKTARTQDLTPRDQVLASVQGELWGRAHTSAAAPSPKRETETSPSNLSLAAGLPLAPFHCLPALFLSVPESPPASLLGEHGGGPESPRQT